MPVTMASLLVSKVSDFSEIGLSFTKELPFLRVSSPKKQIVKEGDEEEVLSLAKR